MAYFSTCVCEHIKFVSMKEKIEDLHDDYIYTSNFEENFDYVVQVEDIVVFFFKSRSTYFNLLN